MREDPSVPFEQSGELQAALADRYAVEEVIGSGGMGIVYLAHDIRHDRKVALKIVRPEIAASVGGERFLREIRIEAGLSHPHILPVYDSGEANGFLYCVMPFIKGESLRHRLDREGQLPCPEALRICREVADGLSFAHAQGIIHRDVKPANILLEAGHAFLADFGLAKALSVAGDAGLTRAGFAVGTPAYASPEQAAGEANVDGRSDLYALGCVLYEMLAGQPPFVGPTADSVVRQHMTLAAPSVRIIRPAASDAVEEILERALAKAPADRFQTAEELTGALDAAVSGEWLAGQRPRKPKGRQHRKYLLPAAAAVVVLGVLGSWFALRGGPDDRGYDDRLDPRSVAVLYFQDLSPDSAYQYVADGLTEGLIGELARVGGLDVVSRYGTQPFQGSRAPLDSIADVLKAGTLVQGSVEALDDRFRISVRLVDGISGDFFDRRTFDIGASDLLSAEDSLSQEVAWLLRERLGEEVTLRRRRARASSVEAWGLTQKGEKERKRAQELLRQGETEAALVALGRADSLLAAAEREDPQWPEPPGLRAWVAYRVSRSSMEYEDILSAVDAGLGHAERALSLDPNDASALEARGTLRYWLWLLGVNPDPQESEALLEEAQADLEAAVDIDPSRASAYSTLSHLYYQVSDPTSALISARAAYEADVFLDSAPEVLWRLFLASYDTERFTQAQFACQEGDRRFPTDYRFSECQIWEMTLPSVRPNVPEAWRLQDQTVERTPEAQRGYEDHRTQIIVAEVLARANLPDSARSVLLRARAGADVDPNGELPFFEAHVRTVLGDYDEAIERLNTYLAGFYTGGGGDPGDWATHWWWRDLQSNPGFKALIEATK